MPSKFPVTSPCQRHITVSAITPYPLLRSGDVHRLEEFLGANHFTMMAPTISELKMAMRNMEGRSLTVS